MKHTNKKIFTGIVSMIGAFAFALPVFAATTASLSPSAVTVATGQRFNVAVSIDPEGTKNYAEKVQVDYPAALLQVVSFTPGGSWVSLPQSGYDSIDNTNGVLIKTAGYPGGISSPTGFGTILFTAKKAGSGTIIIDGTSIAFISTGQIALSGTGSAFTVTSAVVSPAASASPSGASASLAPVTSVNGQAVASSTTLNSQVAAANAAVPQGGGSFWTWFVIIVLIIFVIVASSYALIERKNKK